MSEFSLSSTEECPKRKKTTLSSLILSDFHFFCSFLLSHPLYFSYFLFFSPYIFKILSFLSPLVITTTLLLLALLSTLHVHDTCSSHPEFLESHPSLLFSSYGKLGSVLRSKFDVKDEDIMSSEELQAYNMVFQSCLPEPEPEEACSTTELTFVDKFCSHESTGEVGTVSEALWEETNEEEAEIPKSKTEDLMNLEEEFVKCENEEELVKPIGTVVNKDEGDKWEVPTKIESKAQKVSVDGKPNDEERELPKLNHFLGKISVDDDDVGEKENAESHKSKGDITLSSFGSMREKKEWRRTLACKLFEERHNVAGVGGGGGGGGDDGGERMDLLWEAYETHVDKTPLRSSGEKKERKKSEKQKPKNMKSKNIEEIYKHEAHDDDDYNDDDDDGGDEQLCCLQALKFSTGKMNLGIARPNFLKLSKAFKGFGRFHSVSKHSTKKT